ncbi:hypothetical protein Bca52824_054371 [Brassica carinata]|uniref:Uncharacterized protein n=1 Tax=Brassica carinata TaxID=52824 RepID=A0A8X7R7A2_BRACI|nr:hypothetical protein Bca52824_054371 [Brassica carinata]
MTKSKPNKKENKSKTSEEPTHRKPQQEVLFFLSFFFFPKRISKIHDRVFVGVSGFATDVQKLGGTTFSVMKRTWAVGYWWLELSWCLDGHGSFHPNPSELGRLCSFEDVNSLLFIFKCFESTL